MKEKQTYKRSKEEKESDLHRIALFLVHGKSLQEIANLLNQDRHKSKHITFQQVHKDVKQVQNDWANSYALKYDIALALQVMRYNKIIDKALTAFERSTDKRTRQIQSGFLKNGTIDEKQQRITKVTETQNGNAEFLAIARDAIEKQTALLEKHHSIKSTNDDSTHTTKRKSLSWLDES